MRGLVDESFKSSAPVNATEYALPTNACGISDTMQLRELCETRVAEAPREISKSAPGRKMSTVAEVLAVLGKLKDNTAGLPQSDRSSRFHWQLLLD